MYHAHPPLDLQPGEIETTQFGGDLRCSALDHNPPRDGDAERNHSSALLPAQNQQTSWIADSDHPIFGLHVRHRPLEVGLVEFGYCIIRAHGQPGTLAGDDEPTTR